MSPTACLLNAGRKVAVGGAEEAARWLAAGYAPTKLISLVGHNDEPPEHWYRFPSSKLGLAFDDIPAAVSGPYVGATKDQVEFVLNFARGGYGDILVHCAMGLSRSPAIAALILCDALPPGAEAESFERLLNVRLVEPNPWVLQLGDEVLGRNGAILRAAAGVVSTVNPGYASRVRRLLTIPETGVYSS